MTFIIVKYEKESSKKKEMCSMFLTKDTQKDTTLHICKLN